MVKRGMKFIVLNPIYPSMTKEDMERLDEIMRKYIPSQKERGRSYRSGSKQRKESKKQNSKRGRWKGWNEILID